MCLCDIYDDDIIIFKDKFEEDEYFGNYKIIKFILGVTVLYINQ